MNVNESVGRRLRYLRESKGCTQKIIAEILDFPDISYVSKLENGIRRLSYPEAQKLADFYNMDIDDFIEYLSQDISEPLRLPLTNYGKVKIEINEEPKDIDIVKAVNDIKAILETAIKQKHITEETAKEILNIFIKQLTILVFKQT